MLQLQYMHKYHEKRITTYSPLSELNTQRFRCPEFDTIDWKGSEYIEMTKPDSTVIGLTTNEKYKFSESGSYKFDKIDENLSFYVTVYPEEALLIDLEVQSDNMNFD